GPRSSSWTHARRDDASPARAHGRVGVARPETAMLGRRKSSVGSNPTSTATDLHKHQHWPTTGACLRPPWSHLLVSVTSCRQPYPRDHPRPFCPVPHAPHCPEPPRTH